MFSRARRNLRNIRERDSQPPQLLPLIVLPDPDIGGHWFARLGGVQVIPHDEL